MNQTTPLQLNELSYRSLALALRGRSGLTQRDLAVQLGVSDQAIQNWESGRSHPKSNHLKRLITLYLEHGVFTPGREAEEARAVWEALRRGAAQRVAHFDQAWFDALPDPPRAPVAIEVHVGRQDWGEAPEVADFVDREDELAALSHWLLVDRCRLVAVLGLGGIGKTALVANLAQQMASHFDVVFWRSLRNALPIEEWLSEAIRALDPARSPIPARQGAQLRLLLDLMRERRGLLVLDNLETILQPGERDARYRDGYEGYGEVLQQLGESAHQSCLLITGREEPPELAQFAASQVMVRTLRLAGLGPEAGRTLLQDLMLAGDSTSWQTLISRYGGNPWALKVVGQTAAELFGGELGPFLTYTDVSQEAVFGGVRQLLDAQFERLSELERTLVYWLAVEREAVRPEQLVADLGPEVGRREPLEALEALRRRSLLERGAQGGTLTLQPVVLEYATERLVTILAQEIVTAQPALLVSHALLQATAKEYVRRCQERMIARPLLERLGNGPNPERRLLDLLTFWQHAPSSTLGYGPGNVVNLLRLQRGDLRGVDLSGLAIRQAYLQGVDAQEASLAGSQLAESVLAEAFNHPASVVLSADGAYAAAGTSTGEVRLWRVGDRMPLLSVQGHAGVVLSVALGGDGALAVSGSYDGTIGNCSGGAAGLITYCLLNKNSISMKFLSQLKLMR